MCWVRAYHSVNSNACHYSTCGRTCIYVKSCWSPMFKAAEAVGLEPTTPIKCYLFSRQVPHPAGLLPI